LEAWVEAREVAVVAAFEAQRQAEMLGEITV
jgi:hypothetical protein